MTLRDTAGGAAQPGHVTSWRVHDSAGGPVRDSLRELSPTGRGGPGQDAPVAGGGVGPELEPPSPAGHPGTVAGLLAARATRRGAPAADPMLVYVFDPYCPWSYGYLPVLTHLFDAVAGEVQVEVVVSGTHVGTPIQDTAAPTAAIQAATGAVFGPGYRQALAEGTLELDSREAAAAVIALLAAGPGRTGEVLTGVQHAFFRSGRSLSESATALAVAADLGLDAAGVEAFLRSPLALELADEDAALARALGAGEGPLLLLSTAGRLVQLEGPGTSGERLLEQLRSTLRP